MYVTQNNKMRKQICKTMNMVTMHIPDIGQENIPLGCHYQISNPLSHKTTKESNGSIQYSLFTNNISDI